MSNIVQITYRNRPNYFPIGYAKPSDRKKSLHKIQLHSGHYNLLTKLIKMGRGGKRVRNWSDPSAFKANKRRAAVVAVEEEVEAVVGVEGDNETIATTVPVTTRLTRRTRS